MSSSVFYSDNATVYYLQGTTGWVTFDLGDPNRPAIVLWNPQVKDYTCTDNGDGTCTITGYTGAGGVVTIPGTISNLQVRSIGDFAFNQCSSLTSVAIPDSVTNIGDFALQGCSNLTTVTIGTNVTSMGNGTFTGCSSLANVMIPNSVTSIGDSMFAGCSSLTAIAVDTNNSAYSSLDGVLFDKSQTILIAFPGGKAGNYTIPNSVTNIGNGAFEGCLSLTGLIIPDGVTRIEDWMFAGCSSLTSLVIPDGVVSIGYCSFYGCSSLTNMVIGKSVATIGDDAFYGCSSLIAIAVDTNNSAYSSLDGVLFDKNQTILIAFPGGKAGSYTIPNSVTCVGDWAFASRTNLTSVTIPASVTNIGYEAFIDCSSLMATVVDTNNPVYSSADGFLFDKSQTTLIQCPGGKAGSCTIPASVTNIGFEAFAGCPNLTGVHFKGSAPAANGRVFCRMMPDGALRDCTYATVYYLPGTTGWTNTLGGSPAVLWNPHAQVDANFGVKTNGFGFTISGSTNLVIVTEVCTNLLNPVWSPMATNTLTGGWSYFGDPSWTNYPVRFYRFRSL